MATTNAKSTTKPATTAKSTAKAPDTDEMFEGGEAVGGDLGAPWKFTDGETVRGVLTKTSMAKSEYSAGGEALRFHMKLTRPCTITTPRDGLQSFEPGAYIFFWHKATLDELRPLVGYEVAVRSEGLVASKSIPGQEYHTFKIAKFRRVIAEGSSLDETPF